MKKANLILIFMAVLVVLSGCQKDKTLKPMNPEVTVDITAGSSEAAFSISVNYPGTFDVVLEVSRASDSTDTRTIEVTEVEGKYQATMGNLQPTTLYFYRVGVKNSFRQYFTLFENFTTQELPNYQIVVSANPNDWGTVMGGGTYCEGDTCTVTAMTNTGYNFVNWTENGTQVFTETEYTFPVTGDRTLVANFTSQAYIITAIVDPTEGGTATGSGGYNYGDECTLTAMPNEFFSFVNWTKEDGTQVSTEETYTFTVTGTATYVAHFQLQSYTINVFANPTDGGTMTGGGEYNYGENCTVMATPNMGYSFDNWTENDTVVSTDANYTFTVMGNRTLVANFTQQHYTISVSANPSVSGTVTGGGSNYTYGQTCTLIATANTGYTFTNWTENSIVVSSNASYTFTVTGDRTLVANFSLQTYTVSVSVNPTNGGIVTGGGSYSYGQSCSVTAMANTGYTFTNWTENGTVISNSASYTFTVTGDRTLMVNFTELPPAPTGAINGLFTINSNGDQVYFSKGNLQYIGSASTPYWKFADNQWDYLGDNGQGSTNQNVDRDLFGWGTSNWNNGNTYFHPWDTDNSDGSLYGPPGHYNLTGSYAHADWGVHNTIYNGGGQAGQWRTLTGGTGGEWDYVFNTRSTTSGIRYAKAQIAGTSDGTVNGVILFPDEWNTNTYTPSSYNTSGASFSSNVITSTQWNILQQAGAVFLPTAGSRDGTSVSDVGFGGYYWSATCNINNNAQDVKFYNGSLANGNGLRCNGSSVRLVRSAQ